MTNRELATKIFEELKIKGAGVGSISIIIIEKVLNQYVLDGTASALSAAGQSSIGNKQIDDYEFNLKRGWKGEEDGKDNYGGTIKHFQD